MNVLLGSTNKKGLTAQQPASPLNALGVLFLSESTYCARASICYGLTALL